MKGNIQRNNKLFTKILNNFKIKPCEQIFSGKPTLNSNSPPFNWPERKLKAKIFILDFFIFYFWNEAQKRLAVYEN